MPLADWSDSRRVPSIPLRSRPAVRPYWRKFPQLEKSLDVCIWIEGLAIKNKVKQLAAEGGGKRGTL